MKEKIHLELRYSAIGGQGLITAGAILADAVVEYQGLYAIHSPRYTAQVRGGPTKVDVIIDSEPIVFPNTTAVDFYLSTSKSSFEQYFQNIKEGAIIVIDSNLVGDFEDKRYKVYKVPIIEATARELGNVVVVSVVSLGITAKLTGIISKENLRKAILEKAPKGYEELNLKALELGFSLV